MRTRYTGSLRSEATHGPSGATIQTDDPKDNVGKGESFSPTDIGTITIDVHVPVPLSDENKLRLQAATETCPMVKSLTTSTR
jgi:uncharacterized OsmC-like protein